MTSKADMNNNLGAYKWSIFCSMYAGYSIYMLDRKCFSFAAPTIMEEEGLDKDDLGLVTSSLSIAYAVSKFSSGVAADRLNAKSLFNIGLLLSGVVILMFSGLVISCQSLAFAFSLFTCGIIVDTCNPKLLFMSGLSLSAVIVLSIAACSSVPIYASLWFVCGIVQGAGWPACAKMLRQWFTKSEFGTWWSVLSTSMNLAGSAGPLLASYLIINYGWRTCMHVFGTMSLGAVAICSFTLVESPESVGLVSAQVDSKPIEDKGRLRGRGTWQDLLRGKFMWLLCCGYAVVFMIRTAAQDWSQLYLIHDCKQSQYMGSIFLSSLETGGILGSIIAGYTSDKLIAMSKNRSTQGTPRMTVMLLFLFLNLVFLHAFVFHINEHSSELWIMFIGFGLGFALYGPIALYGIMAIESAPSHISGTSQAIVALAANVGAVLSGLPFSIIATHFEWRGAFIFAEVLLAAVLVSKILCRNMEYKMIPIKKKLQ